jgi:hypothetical protein
MVNHLKSLREYLEALERSVKFNRLIEKLIGI